MTETNLARIGQIAQNFIDQYEVDLDEDLVAYSGSPGGDVDIHLGRALAGLDYRVSGESEAHIHHEAFVDLGGARARVVYLSPLAPKKEAKS